MKTLVIYTPTWHAFGGGEKYILLLAIALNDLPDVSVSLISGEPAIARETLEGFANVDLSKIDYQTIRSMKEIESLSKQVDIFVCLSNYQTIRSTASKHVQLLQIPYGEINLSTYLTKLFTGKFKECAKDILRLRLLRFSSERSDLVITNSKFVSDTLERNFGIQSQVLFPPIQDYSRPGISKKNIILSVGRIFRGLYNNKRYDILTKAFRQASQKELSGWEYHIAGSVAQNQATSEYLSSLRDENKNYPVYFHVNEPYESLVRLYNEASVFWHAAGYNVDEETNPENVEHFGMTTIESMSARCIPVVINKGGQRESVSHGVDGFLWSSIDELIARTSDVINGRCDLEDIRRHARKRYEDFDLDHFRRSVVELFSPLLK